MRRFGRTIDQTLQQTAYEWKWFRFFRTSASVGTWLTVGILLLGIAISLDWLTHADWVRGYLTLVIGGSAMTWIVLTIRCVAEHENSDRLAAVVEHAQPWLLDRLNTVVFLEGQPGKTPHPYAGRIEQQATTVLTRTPPRHLFSQFALLRALGCFAAVLLATVLFYRHFDPWSHVKDRPPIAVANGPPAAAAVEIPSLDQPVANAEPPAPATPWGEVRITRPGVNLRATRLEIVPLQIEAAASRPMTEVSWVTSVNGQDEVPHALPKPLELGDGLYSPELDLNALDVQDWDVVSYYARATCEDGQTYRSAVFFVDVVPFREELERIPAGQTGSGPTWLDQLTAVIEDQQQVINETQSDVRPEEDSQERREALARKEADLASRTKHLAAEIESALPAEPPLRQRWQQAESELEQAQSALRSGEQQAALQSEREALADLIAARKDLHERLRQEDANQEERAAAQPDKPPRVVAWSEAKRLVDKHAGNYAKVEQNPAPFTPEQLQRATQQTRQLFRLLKEHAEQEPEDDPLAVELRPQLSDEKQHDLSQQCDKLSQTPDAQARQPAAAALQRQLERLSQAIQAGLEQQEQQRSEQLAQRLAQLQQQEERLQTAREAVRKMRGEQQELEKGADTPDAEKLRQLAAPQQKLSAEFQEFTRKNEDSLSNCQQQCAGAQGAMQQAASAMSQGQPQAREQAGQASEALQKLDDALGQEQQTNRLSQAYQLKRLLNEQLRQTQRYCKQGGSSAQAQRLGQQCQSLTDQLQNLAQQPGQGLGPELGRALRPEEKQPLDAASQRLAQAQGAAEGQAAARELQPRLEALARAFEASCPNGTAGRSKTSLRPTGQEAVDRGLRQIESAARRQAKSGSPSPEAQSRLGREALRNLQAGLPGEDGAHESSQAAVDTLRQKLEEPAPVIDMRLLEQLRQEVARSQRETAASAPAPETKTEKTHADPSRFPPAYRKAIEKYFEKLSEQP